MLPALCLLLLPQVAMPRPQDLLAARGDEVELGRLGCRLGPARLLRMAEGPGSQRTLALLALGACGATDGLVAAQGLAPLVELLGRAGDDRLLAAAAQAALRLSQRLGQKELEGDGASEDLPRAAQGLLRLAADAQLPAELRADLVEAATALPRHLWSAADLAPLGRSPDRPVRQAALVALVQLSKLGEVERLTQDKDSAVATSAAAALCEAQPQPSPALSQEVRRLAADKDGDLTSRRQLIPCLRRLWTAADRALVAALSRARKRDL